MSTRTSTIPEPDAMSLVDEHGLDCGGGCGEDVDHEGGCAGGHEPGEDPCSCADEDGDGGHRGPDAIIGSEGPDLMKGTAHGDEIHGRVGADVIAGGMGADALFGGPGNDLLYGGHGDDWLKGGRHDDVLDGGNGNDEVQGNGGSDILHGGNGDDVLYGGSGMDTLVGGRGNDMLVGGCGSDTFVFEKQDGIDVVLDFTAAGGDTIEFRGGLPGGVDAFEELMACIADVEGNAVIALGDSAITLVGVRADGLDATQFAFTT